MVGEGVQLLLAADTFYLARGGLDVGDDLKPRVCGCGRLFPGAKAFDDRRVNLRPARARHDDSRIHGPIPASGWPDRLMRRILFAAAPGRNRSRVRSSAPKGLGPIASGEEAPGGLVCEGMR